MKTQDGASNKSEIGCMDFKAQIFGLKGNISVLRSAWISYSKKNCLK